MSAGPRASVPRLVAAVASGALLVLASPPLDQRWAAFVALIPLLIALRGGLRARAGFLLGLLAGLTFFGILLAWISTFGYLAWAALSLLMATSWGLFGAIAARTDRLGAGARTLGWPLLWAGLELARGRYPLGGFTWGTLGVSQIGGGAVLHLARWGGVVSVSAAIVVVNVLAVELIGPSGRAKRALVAAAAIVVLIAPGSIALGMPSAGALDVAAVQPNVPRQRFTSLGRAGRTGPEDTVIVDNAVRATAGIPVEDPPDLVVWPENALDRDPRTSPEVWHPTESAVRRLGVPFLVGAILDEGTTRFRNSVLFVDASGAIAGRYDKTHLVPFGEYVPWSWVRSIVPALDRELPEDGVPGRGYGVFAVGGARVGTVICFESTYPSLVREVVRSGAQVLVVATNDASFGTSEAAREHLDLSRMRAVETGRWVVHAAISGVTGIVAPDGRVTAGAGLWRTGVVRASVPVVRVATPWTRYGSAIEIAIGAVAASLALLALLPARRA